MKRQERDQLRQKSKAELLKDIAEAQRQLVTSRMSKDQQVMSNVRLAGQARRKVAVLHTFLRTKGT